MVNFTYATAQRGGQVSIVRQRTHRVIVSSSRVMTTGGSRRSVRVYSLALQRSAVTMQVSLRLTQYVMGRQVLSSMWTRLVVIGHFVLKN